MSQIALRLIAEYKAMHARGQDASSLYLGYCGLTEIPEELFECTWLEELVLSDRHWDGTRRVWVETPNRGAPNNIDRLSQNFSKLSRLKTLRIGGKWPSRWKLSDVNFLRELTGLRLLDLSNNHISDVSSLRELTSLQHLNLRNNELSDVDFLRELTGLTFLDLTHNKIKKISLAFLEGLNLEPDIENDYGFGKILLKNNPIEYPPIEVLKKGREFTIAYLKDDEKQPLNECKVIIVGRGGVGKTSLQKRLTYQPFDPHEPKTHGIRKVSWREGGVKASDGNSITVNFWDFGGQDIQQTLHQFFYSKNTVYILVLNKRLDEDPEDFLELVRTYGHNSPVLIAYNTMIKLDGEGKATYDLTPELDSSLRSKYPNIRERTFGLCCGQDQDLGIDELRKYLKAYIPTLDHVQKPYPSSWLTIKRELLSKVQSNYIDYEDYEEICRPYRVEETIKKGLVEMLNDVGTITYFNRQFLGNYYILNPDWLTTGAYQIIDSKQTTKKRGRISADDLRIIFSQPLPFSYKSYEYEFLLQLMEEFDLCHKFSKGEWLIPSSLEGKSKMDLVAFRNEEHRQYCIKFATSLPTSIIHRFIARNIKHAYEEDYWCNGIVLKHPDSATLMYVESDAREKEIRLWIKGENIRDCWEFFRKDIREFSDKFDYRELVTLQEGVRVSYQALLVCLKAGEVEWFVPELGKRINVQATLGLFEKQKSKINVVNDRGQAKKYNLTANDVSEIIKLIDDNEIEDVFDLLDNLKISDQSLAQLRLEFENAEKGVGVSYFQRLRTCIKRLSK